MVATVGASVVGAGAAIYGGYQQKVAADQTAKQLELQGKENFAAAQRGADEQTRQAQLLASAQQAQAAGSGGGAGADAPTIVRLMTETAKRGEYNSESALFSGQAYQESANAAASAARAGGTNSFLGGFMGAAGRLTSGAGDFARIRKEFP